MGTDWYEAAMVESDRVLDDFIKAITPSIADPKQPFKWLQRLDVEGYNIINPRSCTAIKTCLNRRPESTCPNVYYSCADGTLVYGYRNYHCKPDTCNAITCRCCEANPGPNCGATCAAANKANCPS